jgi:O-antigen/teichoic acid export membrane protein
LNERSETLPPNRVSLAAGLAVQIAAQWRRLCTKAPSLTAVGDQAVVSAASFLTATIIGRTTSTDEMGLYYLTLSIMLIVSGIQEQAVTAPYMIYSKRGKSGQELAEYYGSAWLHHGVLTLATVLAVAVGAMVVAIAGAGKLASGLAIVAAVSPLILLREGIRRFSIANLDVAVALAIDCAVAVLQLGALLAISKWGSLSLWSVYTVMGGACGLAALAWYLLAEKPAVSFRRERVRADWVHNWGFVSWALRGYLIGNTTPQIMPWIVGLSAGTSATGVLGACGTLVGVSNIFVLGVGNLLTPGAALAMSEGGAAELVRVLSRAALLVGLALGSFCLFIAATGDLLAVLVYGEQYQGTGMILLLLALAMLMNGMGMILGNGLWAIDRPRANFVGDLCGFGVTLLAAAILVVPWGALGAAAAALVGTSTATVVRGLMLYRSLATFRRQHEVP